MEPPVPDAQLVARMFNDDYKAAAHFSTVPQRGNSPLAYDLRVYTRSGVSLDCTTMRVGSATLNNLSRKGIFSDGMFFFKQPLDLEDIASDAPQKPDMGLPHQDTQPKPRTNFRGAMQLKQLGIDVVE